MVAMSAKAPNVISVNHLHLNVDVDFAMQCLPRIKKGYYMAGRLAFQMFAYGHVLNRFEYFHLPSPTRSNKGAANPMCVCVCECIPAELYICEESSSPHVVRVHDFDKFQALAVDQIISL